MIYLMLLGGFIFGAMLFIFTEKLLKKWVLSKCTSCGSKDFTSTPKVDMVDGKKYELRKCNSCNQHWAT